jgi:hypothetical protein
MKRKCPDVVEDAEAYKKSQKRKSVAERRPIICAGLSTATQSPPIDAAALLVSNDDETPLPQTSCLPLVLGVIHSDRNDSSCGARHPLRTQHR